METHIAKMLNTEHKKEKSKEQKIDWKVEKLKMYDAQVVTETICTWLGSWGKVTPRTTQSFMLRLRSPVNPHYEQCMYVPFSIGGCHEPRSELDSKVDKCISGNNCLVSHNNNSPINFYIITLKNRHEHAYTVDATVAFNHTQTGVMYVLVIIQVIMVKGHVFDWCIILSEMNDLD